MSAREKITRVDDNTYTYASHTIAFSRPSKTSAWTVEVTGPVVKRTMVLAGKRDALAKEVATAIMLAKATVPSSTRVLGGRVVRG